jgi:gliding motility-associated-like protein
MFFHHEIKRIQYAIICLVASFYSSEAQTVNFTYTGAVQSYTVPAGVTKVTILADGAGGGGGGNDTNGPGLGGAGAKVSTDYDVCPGQVLSIIVGGAGIRGNSGNAAAGGSGGYGGGTYNGGAGGNAGGSGSSGAGAGGGGATVVLSGATLIVVAAGGGGGGGGGNTRVGYNGGVGNTDGSWSGTAAGNQCQKGLVSGSANGIGVNGQSFSGDGAGGGGGGGGYRGGGSGEVSGCDCGGCGGAGGTSYFIASGTSNASISNGGGSAGGGIQADGTNGSLSITPAQICSAPTATVSGSSTVCANTSSPVAVTFTGTGGTTPYRFLYTVNGGATQTLVSTGNIATTTVSTASATTYTYNLISVIDNSGNPACCSLQPTNSVIIVIRPVPTAMLSGNSATVCQGATIPNIILTGSNGTAPYTFTYSINGSSTNASGSNSFTINPSTATIGLNTYSLLSVQDVYCSQTQTGGFVIDVRAIPTVSLSIGTNRVCQHATPPDLKISTSNGTHPYTFIYSESRIQNGVASSPTLYTVSTSGNSSTLNVPASTIIADTIRYTVVNVIDAVGLNCSPSSNNIDLIVDPVPMSKIVAASNNVCLNDADQPLYFESYGVPAPVTFNYYKSINGGPDVEQTPVGNGTLTYTLMVSATSIGTTLFTNGISNSNVCSGNQGNGSASITVNPLPTATISINGSLTICDNGTTKVRFTGSVGQPPYTFSYNINNGSTKQISTPVGTHTVDLMMDTVPGTYTVNLTAVRDQNNCNKSQMGNVVISVDALPTAVSTASTTICMDGSTTINTATASNYSVINWTKTTNGTLSHDNTIAPTYAAAIGDANTVVTLTMTVTGTLSCTAEKATATYKIAVDSLPLALISGNSTICQNASKTITGAIARNGSILWTHNGQGNLSNATSINPTYNAAAGDANGIVTLTMTVTGTNACTNTSSATYNIHVDPIPQAATNGNATICQNATYTLVNGEVTQSYGSIAWTENGAGSITAGGTTLFPTYTAAAVDAGSAVTLTMTVTSTNTCVGQTAVAMYNINVDRLPTASAGGSKAICQDNAYTLAASETSQTYGTVQWTHSGQGLLTNTTSLTPTYTAVAGDATSVVTLTMTVTSTNTCNPQFAKAFYAIQIDPLPAVNVAGAVSICKGTTHTLPVGSATYTNGNIAWTKNGLGNLTNANSLTPTYNASALESGATVTLTLTVTSNNTCTSSILGVVRDTYTIKVDSTPVAFAGGSRTICQNNAVTLGGTSYKDGTILWTHNGQGAVTNATTLTPTYTAKTLDAGSLVTLKMTVSSNNSCAPRKDSAYYYVTVDRLPQVTVSGSNTICANTSHQIEQNAATSNYGSILWSKPNSASGYISAGVNTLRPTYAAGLNDGGSVVTLTMTVTSTNTCYPASTFSTYPITIREVPFATIAGTTTLCEGDDATNIIFTATGGMAPYTFTYALNGGGTQSVSTTSLATTATVSASALSAGQFAYNLLSVNNGYNCTQIQSGLARVTVNKLPEATITHDATVCQGTSAPIITLTGSNGTAPYTFSYTLNNNEQTPIASSGSKTSFTHATADAGRFVYRISSVAYNRGKTCSKAQTDSVVIVVNPLPQAEFSGQRDACKDSARPVLIFKGINSSAPYTFTFKVNSDNNASLTTSANQDTYSFDVKTDKAGTFNYLLLKVTDSKGCSTQPNHIQTVKVYENPIANFIATPIRTTILEPTIDIMESSISAETYQWNYGDGSKSTQKSPGSYTYKALGRYKLKLYTTSFNGTCKDSMIQEIVIEQPKLVYIPNSFSPNEDGVNDEFKIEGEGIEKLEMSIYDRWGNLVFYSEDKGWDGKFKGKLVPIDTYVYLVITKDVKGHDTTYRGVVNVVR